MFCPSLYLASNPYSFVINQMPLMVCGKYYKPMLWFALKAAVSTDLMNTYWTQKIFQSSYLRVKKLKIVDYDDDLL